MKSARPQPLGAPRAILRGTELAGGMLAEPARPRRVRVAGLALPILVATLMGSCSGDGPTAGEPTVVTFDGAAVRVHEEPFRLEFEDESGAVVLSQVDVAESIPLPTMLDPEPWGADKEPETTLYAPFVFTVGETWRRQLTAFFSGNLHSVGLFGALHGATRLISIDRTPEGADLEVATTSPEHRLVVELRTDGPSAIRVRARVDPPAGVVTLGDSFRSDGNEGFHGFGGRHNAVNQRGVSLYSFAEQENLHPGIFEFVFRNGPGAGEDQYLLPNGPTAAYYPQNLFYSSRGFGVLVTSDTLTRFRMGVDRDDAWQLSDQGAEIDYTVALGGLGRAMKTLTGINGRHRLPPPWSQRPLVWRATQVGSETPETYRAKIEADLVEIERRDIPIAGYSFEFWRVLDPDYVRSVVDRLDAMGIRSILYTKPWHSETFLGHVEAPGIFQEIIDEGLGIRTDAGDPFLYLFSPPPNPADAVTLDLTLPAAIDWWERELELMVLEMGADGFMQDFGEAIFDGMRFADGSNGVDMHNRFGTHMHRLTREWLERNGRDDVWFITRSGFSGRPGAAAHESGNFPGDETPDWTPASGIRSIAPDMLNRAVGGAFGFSTNIGGYLDFLTDPADRELFVRWMQWAVFTPYFRVHNSSTAGTQMPWDFDDEVYQWWLELGQLHDRATPYLRELWAEGLRTGIPPTRPMWLAFPDDPAARDLDQQWMLGPDVLVAPVVDEGARTWELYVPAGCWESEQGERLDGPGLRTVDAPLGRLPWFRRCGTNPF